jgi:hypothetical protein
MLMSAGSLDSRQHLDAYRSRHPPDPQPQKLGFTIPQPNPSLLLVQNFGDNVISRLLTDPLQRHDGPLFGSSSIFDQLPQNHGANFFPDHQGLQGSRWSRNEQLEEYQMQQNLYHNLQRPNSRDPAAGQQLTPQQQLPNYLLSEQLPRSKTLVPVQQHLQNQGCGSGLIQYESGASIFAQSGSSSGSGSRLKQNFRRQFFLKSKFESNQIKNTGVFHQFFFQKVVLFCRYTF